MIPDMTEYERIWVRKFAHQFNITRSNAYIEYDHLGHIFYVELYRKRKKPYYLPFSYDNKQVITCLKIIGGL